jgi:hypothetical protein
LIVIVLLEAMTDPEHYVGNVEQAVRLIDVLSPSDPGAPRTHTLELKSLEDVERWLNGPGSNNYVCRYLSICQQTSWSPLQITKPMLDMIVSRHGINQSFWQIPSCFYTRVIDLEETYCVPLVVEVNGSITGK